MEYKVIKKIKEISNSIKILPKETPISNLLEDMWIELKIRRIIKEDIIKAIR